jgi:hypothetical protein
MTSDVEERLRLLERKLAELERKYEALVDQSGRNTQLAALLRSAAKAG